jgi:hypothetical protein
MNANSTWLDDLLDLADPIAQMGNPPAQPVKLGSGTTWLVLGAAVLVGWLLFHK